MAIAKQRFAWKSILLFRLHYDNWICLSSFNQFTYPFFIAPIYYGGGSHLQNLAFRWSSGSHP